MTCLLKSLGLLKSIKLDLKKLIIVLGSSLKLKHHPLTHSESCQEGSEDVDQNDVLTC